MPESMRGDWSIEKLQISEFRQTSQTGKAGTGQCRDAARRARRRATAVNARPRPKNSAAAFLPSSELVVATWQSQPPPSSESAADATHFCVVGSHVGVAGFVQSLFIVQPTHACDVGLQIGVSPGQSVDFVHVEPQVCEPLSQTLPAGQSDDVAQPSHLCETGSHTGVSPGQSVLFEHVVPHVSVLVSQISPFGQLEFIVHCTHCFVIGLQTGLSPGHSELAVQVAVH
jgi:hypothetical protein